MLATESYVPSKQSPVADHAIAVRQFKSITLKDIDIDAVPIEHTPVPSPKLLRFSLVTWIVSIYGRLSRPHSGHSHEHQILRLRVIGTVKIPLRVCSVGLVLALSCSEAWSQRLLFREGRQDDLRLWPYSIPGFDHMGFEVAGMVWESHPGYTGEFPFFFAYWDPEQLRRIGVFKINGVQAQHTASSFEWNSSSSSVSGTQSFADVPIDPELAGKMWEQAILLEGSPYPPVNPLYFTSPNQKGGLGTFTCVGLIEHLAELANYNCGQGFVPNVLEFAPLTPSTLQWAATNKIGEKFCAGSPAWLGGGFDPLDFLLTDPLGRRLGHTIALGTVNEIPGAFYSGDGVEESFALLDVLPGEYSLQLFGLGEVALADIRGPNGTVYSLQRHMDLGELVSASFSLLPVDGDALADFDGNGLIDGADLTVWQAGFGAAGATRGQGDATLDGVIDGTDFVNWQRQLRSTTTVAATATVPEPAALLLLVSGLLAMFFRRRTAVL